MRQETTRLSTKAQPAYLDKYAPLLLTDPKKPTSRKKRPKTLLKKLEQSARFFAKGSRSLPVLHASSSASAPRVGLPDSTSRRGLNDMENDFEISVDLEADGQADENDRKKEDFKLS